MKPRTLALSGFAALALSGGSVHAAIAYQDTTGQHRHPAPEYSQSVYSAPPLTIAGTDTASVRVDAPAPLPAKVPAFDPKKQASGDCHMGNCYKEYITDIKADGTDWGILQVNTKRVSYCTPGMPENLCEGEGWSRQYYRVKCALPGYIANVTRPDAETEEPDQHPSHATLAADWLWDSVCHVHQPAVVD
jgi:hypothetical protein